MRAALEAYLSTLNGGGSHRDAVLAAAMTERANPHDVVHHAGLLARCRPAVAGVATGLTPSLRRVPIGSRAAIVAVGPGQRYPVLADKRRHQRGAHDSPVDLARQVVEQALAASDGRVEVGVDIACGPGAFLVAMAAAGVREIYGVDNDPLCLEVAAIACPQARLLQDTPVKHGPPADIVVGGPPFLSRAAVGELRFDFRRRFPWMGGTLDVVAGFAAAASERVRTGGGLGLVLPTEALVRPHGSPWRRRLIERHQVLELVGPMLFPGSSIDVTLLVAQAGTGPGSLPAYGLEPAEALAADNVVLDPERRPGDLAILEAIHAHSVPLGEVAEVSAGISLVGPGDRIPVDLLTDRPSDDRVPFAEARAFFAGERRWLKYKVNRLARPTRRSLYERPKAVIQQSRARAPVRCAVDRDGVFVGSSLTVVTPPLDGIPPEAVHDLVNDPLFGGYLRVQHGRVMDLTARIVSDAPFPKAWMQGASCSLAEAWGLDAEAARVLAAHGGR